MARPCYDQLQENRLGLQLSVIWILLLRKVIMILEFRNWYHQARAVNDLDSLNDDDLAVNDESILNGSDREIDCPADKTDSGDDMAVRESLHRQCRHK